MRGANVLLDKGDRAKISDFGLAKHVTKIANSSGSLGLVSKAANWLAPEIHDGSIARSKKADVFSFAMTLFEIASGEPPFADFMARQIEKKIMNGERPNFPDDNSSLGRDLPCNAVLASIAHLCWNKDPNMRANFSTIAGKLQGLLH